jgi:hypothetical protein
MLKSQSTYLLLQKSNNLNELEVAPFGESTWHRGLNKTWLALQVLDQQHLINAAQI